MILSLPLGVQQGLRTLTWHKKLFEQAAKKQGVTIKVETHGQIGIEKELTPEEIANAKAVIIAADKDVQPQRFVNKKLSTVSVGQGIKNADELVAQALRGEGVVKYHSDMQLLNLHKLHNLLTLAKFYRS